MVCEFVNLKQNNTQWRIGMLLTFLSVYSYSLVFIKPIKQKELIHKFEIATLCYVFNVFPELKEMRYFI